VSRDLKASKACRAFKVNRESRVSRVSRETMALMASKGHRVSRARSDLKEYKVKLERKEFRASKA
jgi:hypothetical protein